jgi:hypothetical protein
LVLSVWSCASQNRMVLGEDSQLLSAAGTGYSPSTSQRSPGPFFADRGRGPRHRELGVTVWSDDDAISGRCRTRYRACGRCTQRGHGTGARRRQRQRHVGGAAQSGDRAGHQASRGGVQPGRAGHRRQPPCRGGRPPALGRLRRAAGTARRVEGRQAEVLLQPAGARRLEAAGARHPAWQALRPGHLRLGLGRRLRLDGQLAVRRCHRPGLGGRPQVPLAQGGHLDLRLRGGGLRRDAARCDRAAPARLVLVRDQVDERAVGTCGRHRPDQRGRLTGADRSAVVRPGRLGSDSANGRGADRDSAADRRWRRPGPRT